MTTIQQAQRDYDAQAPDNSADIAHDDRLREVGERMLEELKEHGHIRTVHNTLDIECVLEMAACDNGFQAGALEAIRDWRKPETMRAALDCYLDGVIDSAAEEWVSAEESEGECYE